MTMDYFRRPALVGKNISRTTVATVRGSVRRSEADGTSAVPYFPNLAVTQTLHLSHQGGVTVVTFTGIDITTVLADINTALGVHGTAVNADGVIELRSAVSGSAGLMSVTGGTGATALGFQVFGGGRPIQARGGELPSSPESRLGNPFGVALPSRGENFTADALQRGLGHLASNSDVLWTDQIKDRVQMRAVSFSVGADRLFITPTATRRLFIGSPNTVNLTAASLKKDLIPFYQLIDTATNLPAASQVVAVVRGTPVGNPPYANSPSWTDATGLNVLGQDHAKVSVSPITTLSEGRIVECLGETFVTKGVRVGDFAEIAGATNLSRWSNNGYRWVVEQVLSETALILRTMSVTELDSVGTTIDDIQPILELNDQKTTLESFGTLTVRTGFFTNGVNLVVRPPIPVGASYELRAASAANARTSVGYEDVRALQPSLLEYGSDNLPTHNGTLSGLQASLSAGDVAVQAGRIRWNGHVHSLPLTTVLNSALTNGINYVYWDEETVSIKNTTVATNFTSLFNTAVTTNKGHLLAIVNRVAGVISEVISASRLVSDAARTVTVGAGGQFANLDEAMFYVSVLATAYGETVTSSGSYPHFEIVLVGDTTYSGGNSSILFNIPGLRIRGVSKNITLTMTEGIRLDACNSFEMSDLRLVASGTPTAVVRQFSVIAANSIRLTNLRQFSGRFAHVVSGQGTGLVDRVVIEECELLVSTGVVSGTPSSTEEGYTSLLSSKLILTVGVAAPQMFTDQYGTTWGGGRLEIDHCLFQASWLTNSTNAMCVETSDAASEVTVTDSLFVLGNNLSTSAGILFKFAGKGTLTRVRNEGQISTFVTGAQAVVSDCDLQCNPEGTAIALDVRNAFNTSIQSMDTAGSAVGGIGIKVTEMAQGNSVTGPFAVGIQSEVDRASILSNSVILTNGTASPLIGIESAGASQSEHHISNNYISMPLRAPGAIAAPVGIERTGSSVWRVFINQNSIVIGQNGIGIRVGTAAAPIDGNYLIISENSIGGSSGATGDFKGIELHGNMADCSVSRNNISSFGAGTASGIFQDTGSYTRFVVSENQIFLDSANGATGGLLFITTPSSSQSIIGNFFQSGTGAQKVSGFSGITSGNQFLGDGTFLISNTQGVFSDNYVSVAAGSATLGSGRYDSNTFGIPNVNMSVTIVDFQFTNNSLTGSFNGTAPSTDHMTFSGNKVAGSVIIVNSADTVFIAVGNEVVTGDFSITGGSGATRIIFVGNSILIGKVIISANEVRVQESFLGSSSPHQISGSTKMLVEGCTFDGRVEITEATTTKFASNIVNGRVDFLADLSPFDLTITGNTIIATSPINPAMSFAAYTFPTTARILIEGNRIRLGLSGGNAPTASCIYFAGDVQNLSVVSNHIEIIGDVDPGGAGTPIYAALYVNTAVFSTLILFSGNHVSIPSDKNFRAATLIIDYKFIRCAQVTALYGAGNLLTGQASVDGPAASAAVLATTSGTPFNL